MTLVGVIYFATGSYVVTPSHDAEIARAVEIIQNADGGVIHVIGNADRQGGVDNLKLSQERANAVALILRKKYGLKVDSVTGVGTTDPAVPGNSALAYVRDRRVEIYLLK
jgi:outer membrane protein OmpA-like peptidoglycan-associated protein